MITNSTVCSSFFVKFTVDLRLQTKFEFACVFWNYHVSLIRRTAAEQKHDSFPLHLLD